MVEGGIVEVDEDSESMKRKLKFIGEGRPRRLGREVGVVRRPRTVRLYSRGVTVSRDCDIDGNRVCLYTIGVQIKGAYLEGILFGDQLRCFTYLCSLS